MHKKALYTNFLMSPGLMCGIAGIFNYRADIVPIKKEELRKIRDYQFARGPDAEGEWHSNGNLLGFGASSIIYN